MAVQNSDVALAGVSLDMGELPHASVYDRIAELVVPQCLAAVLEQRPLDASKLAPFLLPAKEQHKNALVLVQQDMPALQVLAKHGTPGCAIAHSISKFDGEQVSDALARAFLAQPGAEVVTNPDLKTPGAKAWRIRGREAWLVIVTEPEFFAVFSRGE
jgi:hypothetical protein